MERWIEAKRRPAKGADDPPPEVMDRLGELLPDGALDDAVRGLKPEELSGPGGLCRSLPAASSRRRWTPR
jgi:hypothetical protein